MSKYVYMVKLRNEELVMRTAFSLYSDCFVEHNIVIVCGTVKLLLRYGHPV